MVIAMHAWSERSLWLPWPLHHLHLPSHSSLSSSSSFYPSTSLRLSSKIPCALRQGDAVYWRIFLQHRLWAQGLLPHRDVRRVQSGVHDRATVPRGRGLRWCRNRWDALESIPRTSLSLQREGLSVGQSSSSMSDRAGQPVVEPGQEQNLEQAQIRTLLDRQREQILAECRAEIEKHEFQANYDLRSIEKLSVTIESQQEELHRAQADELHRWDQQLLHEQLLAQNRDLRDLMRRVSVGVRIEAISRLYIRHNCEDKIGRRPGHYSGTYW